MSWPTDHARLPLRLPVGARYVVEGYGGDEGNLRVIARYIVLPGGLRINVPGEVNRPAIAPALAFRRKSSRKRSKVKVRTAAPRRNFTARGTVS